MQPETKNILLASYSARALAASAARAGYHVYVIDLFEDFDTTALSVASAKACADHALRFDKIKLQQAMSSFAGIEFSAVIYGAGFEADTGLLEILNVQNNLFGNSPELVLNLKHPTTFFGLLHILNMPFPQVRLTAPSDADGWLAKTIGATGGTHVASAQGVSANDQIYFQQFEAGRNLSVLFLADGKQSRIVGFNEQLVQRVGSSPYCYSGAISHARMPDELKSQIAAKLDLLVETTGLVGLNGIDFILRDEKYFVLEINPRPTATMELYDADFPQGLLHAHVQACEGVLPDAVPGEQTIRGHQIVWAQQNTRVPATFSFPRWCADIPQPGSFIAQGAPLCSVLADAHDHDETLRLLERRSAEIQIQLLELAA